MQDDSYWMGKALAQADRAARLGEVPIGAVLVRDGRVIGRGCNRREGQNDPSAHAEMIAIRQAAATAGRLAADRHHPLRDAGALPDVHGGDHPGAHRAAGVRLP